MYLYYLVNDGERSTKKTTEMFYHIIYLFKIYLFFLNNFFLIGTIQLQHIFFNPESMHPLVNGLPWASSECSASFSSSIPYIRELRLNLFLSGSRKATGKQLAKELRHSPRAGRCLQGDQSKGCIIWHFVLIDNCYWIKMKSVRNYSCDNKSNRKVLSILKKISLILIYFNI